MKGALGPLYIPCLVAAWPQKDTSQSVLSPAATKHLFRCPQRALAPWPSRVSLELTVDLVLFQLLFLGLIARGSDENGGRREPSFYVGLLVFSVLESFRWGRY